MEANTQNQPEQPETTTAPVNQPDISLSDALAGVFSEPGETFTSVRHSTKATYWIVPLIILALITAFSSFIVLNDEELSSEIKKKQTDAMKERFDKAVKEGSMTREQADEQLEKTEQMFSGSMFMVFGMIGGLFSVIVFFFVKALVYWGVLKIFKGTGTFVNMMNVLGLASIITSIQMIIDTVLAIFPGRLFVNIGPILLFTEEQLGSSMYKFVANFDFINIWYLIIAGIGVAKVSHVKLSTSLIVVFVLWLIWVIATSFGPLKFIGG
jgi:Yip1 domain